MSGKVVEMTEYYCICHFSEKAKTGEREREKKTEKCYTGEK